MTRPKLALYRSPENSRSNSDCDGPSVTSPSHVTVAAGHVSRGTGHLHVPRPTDCDGQSYSSRASTNSSQSQKKRKLIIKKPLDTRLRPGWNAPPPKPKRTPYQPFKDWKQKGSWRELQNNIFVRFVNMLWWMPLLVNTIGGNAAVYVISVQNDVIHHWCAWKANLVP